MQDRMLAVLDELLANKFDPANDASLVRELCRDDLPDTADVKRRIISRVWKQAVNIYTNTTRYRAFHEAVSKIHQFDNGIAQRLAQQIKGMGYMYKCQRCGKEFTYPGDIGPKAWCPLCGVKNDTVKLGAL
ncbi:hypothetical protein BAUCODRAFT_35445, partial [Baudoinia panamericana UAMH 10762]